MNSLRQSLFKFFLLLSISTSALLHANDNGEPISLFSSTLYINDEQYDWQEASDDGTIRTDTYYDSTYGYTISVQTLVDAPQLASVSGDGINGSVDGHIDNGTYGDNYSAFYVTSFETMQYTVNLATGELYWIHTESEEDEMGNSSSSWSDSNGEWGNDSYSDSYDFMGNESYSHSWNNSSSGSGYISSGISDDEFGDDIPLFGENFHWSSSSSYWTQDSNGTDNGGSFASYYTDDGASYNMSYTYDNSATPPTATCQFSF